MAGTSATTETRIRAGELRRRLDAGEAATILDVRAPQAWDESDVKVRGAIRVAPDAFQVNLSWPRDRLTVAYCT